MKHLLKAVAWLLALLLAVWLVLAVLERGWCAYAGYTMKRDTHYAPFLGCLIESENGKRIPLSSLREVE